MCNSTQNTSDLDYSLVQLCPRSKPRTTQTSHRKAHKSLLQACTQGSAARVWFCSPWGSPRGARSSILRLQMGKLRQAATKQVASLHRTGTSPSLASAGFNSVTESQVRCPFSNPNPGCFCTEGEEQCQEGREYGRGSQAFMKRGGRNREISYLRPQH